MLPGLTGISGLFKKEAGDSPTVESYSTSNRSNANNDSIDMPSGAVAGDLIIIYVCIATGNGAVSISSEAGWNSLFYMTDNSHSDELHAHRCFYLVLEEGFASSVNINSNINTDWSIIALRISGSSDGIPTLYNNTNHQKVSSVNQASYSPTWGDSYGSLSIVSVSCHEDDISFGTPSGYTKISITSSRNASLAVFYKQFVSTSEDPGSVSLNKNNHTYSSAAAVIGQ